MADRCPVLLVHGACHGSWCWKYLTPQLEQRGFDVSAIDLPGRNPTLSWGWRLRLEDQAAAIVVKAAQMGGRVIAVAHSMGGLAMSVAAEREPALFDRLVYLSAYLPNNGDNLVALGRRDRGSQVQRATRMSPSGFISIRPDRSAPIFYEDCPVDRADWANERLIREPLRPAFDRIALTQRFASVSRSYIRCAKDRVVTPYLQDAMIAAQGCEKVVTLDSSHSPFFSMPDVLSRAIEDVV